MDDEAQSGSTPAASLRSLLRDQAKDALVFTGTTFLNRIGLFLLVPLYWRKLSPADYGIVAVVGILGSFQALLSTMALDLSVTRFFYQWPETERRRNLGAIWIWSSITTIAWGALLLAVMPQVSRFLFPDVSYHPYLWLGIVSNTLANLLVIPAATIRIKRMPWLFAFQNLLSFALSTGLGLWLVLIRDQKIRGYLLSLVWANAGMAFFGAIAMLTFSRPCWWTAALPDAVRFSLPAIPSNLIAVSSSMLDRFLLNYYSNLETLGVYAICMNFVEVVTQLHSSLKMAYGPFIMKELAEDPVQGKDRVAAVTPFYLLPYFFVAMGLVFYIGPFVHLVNRSEYFAVVRWVPWMAGLALVGSMHQYYANGFVLGRRTDLLSIPAAIQLAILVPASVLLIRPYQLTGLVIGRYLSASAFLAVSIYLSQRVYPLPHRWGRLTGLAWLAVVTAAVGYYVHLANPLLEALAKVPLLLACTAVAATIVLAGTRRGLHNVFAWIRAR